MDNKETCSINAHHINDTICSYNSYGVPTRAVRALEGAGIFTWGQLDKAINDGKCGIGKPYGFGRKSFTFCLSHLAIIRR